MKEGDVDQAFFRDKKTKKNDCFIPQKVSSHIQTKVIYHVGPPSPCTLF